MSTVRSWATMAQRRNRPPGTATTGNAPAAAMSGHVEPQTIEPQTIEPQTIEPGDIDRDAVVELAPGAVNAATGPRMAGSLAGSTPIDDEGIDGAWRWRGGWQRWVFPSVWLVYLLQTVSGLGKYSPGGWFLVGCAILLLFCFVYLRGLPFGAGPAKPWQAIAIMVVLTGAEAVLAHQDALVMCTFIGVLAMVAGGKSGPIFVAVLTAVSVALPAIVRPWHAGADWDMLVTLPLVAFAMYGFFTIIRSARELGAARAEVVRLAAENERSRIARDLHDLLGHSLTTITVKAALARRLAERDPTRAAQEIGEVEALTRSVLVDVRAAVAGYREVSLAGELATARHVLRSADVAAHLPGAIDVVPVEYHELFGWVVREGVTNVVRHARANTCTITVGPTWLQVDDDGRIQPIGASRTRSTGTGLLGLDERVQLVGGTVCGAAGVGGWSLRVDVPPLAPTVAGRPVGP